MKAAELLAKVKAGEGIPCDVCGEKIPAGELGPFVFKRGELAPRMENVNVGSIVCVACLRKDPLIKVEPRGPDVKFVRGH
jgi:hypothetical protein